MCCHLHFANFCQGLKVSFSHSCVDYLPDVVRTRSKPARKYLHTDVHISHVYLKSCDVTKAFAIDLPVSGGRSNHLQMAGLLACSVISRLLGGLSAND